MDDWVLVLIVFVSLVAGLVALVVLFFIIQRCCCPVTDADLELENQPPGISPIYVIDSGCAPRHHHPLAAAALVRHHRRHRRHRMMRMGW